MVRPKRQSDPTLLTTLELEIMRVLWVLHQATVHEILERLSSKRDLAYTTVSTVVRVLVTKGFVGVEKHGRSHLYSPNIPRSDYESRTIHHVIDGLFEGQADALVRRLVDSESLSEQELTKIRNLIEQLPTTDDRE